VELVVLVILVQVLLEMLELEQPLGLEVLVV
jgi:hypothetical protein